MRTVNVSEKAVTVLCSEEEIGGGHVLAQVRRALTAEGIAPWPEIRAECFGAGTETLVIARPGGRRRAFLFREREAYESAACLVPAAGRCVYDTADGILLTLPPEDVCPGLYEFGEAVRLRDGWEEHAREQGLCRADDRLRGNAT